MGGIAPRGRRLLSGHGDAPSAPCVFAANGHRLGGRTDVEDRASERGRRIRSRGRRARARPRGPGRTNDIALAPANDNTPDQPTASAAHITFAAQAHIDGSASAEQQLEPLSDLDANETDTDGEAAPQAIADREPTVAGGWLAQPGPTLWPETGEAAESFASFGDEESRPPPANLPTPDPLEDPAADEFLRDSVPANSSEAAPREESGMTAGVIDVQPPSAGLTVPVSPRSTSAGFVSDDTAPRDEDVVTMRALEPPAVQLNGPMPVEVEAVLPSPSTADAIGQRPMPSREAKTISPGAGPYSAPLRPSALDRLPPTPTPGIVFPEAYLQWNRILVEHCLLGVPDRTGPIYLSGTPTILPQRWRASRESFSVLRTPRRFHRCRFPGILDCCSAGNRETLGAGSVGIRWRAALSWFPDALGAGRLPYALG